MGVIGRPSGYTPEIAAEVCDWISGGKSLRGYCEQDGKPNFSTIYDWLSKHEEFSNAFARARETQAHADADRINHVLEEVRAGLIPSDVGRVMADGLKWTAARRAPRAYGDRVALSGDNAGGPITISWEAPTKPG